MRYKNDKKISNLSSPDSFFQAQMHQKPPRTPLGEHTTLPGPLSRLGRGIPPLHTPPRSTPSVSRTRRLRRSASVLRPPQHKTMPVQPVTEKVIFFRL